MARKLDADIDEAALPEADRVGESPHPRLQTAFFGHQAAEASLAEGLFGARPAHAWLIEGPRGIGKATLAYRAARALLGARITGPRPLDCAPEDRVARRLAALGDPDFRVIRRSYDFERKRLRAEIQAEDARALPAFLALTASGGGRRIAIIDSADDLNPQSANALLKIVEEPPAAATIFIVSHNERPLLATIRSRCRLLRLRPLSAPDAASALAAAGATGDVEALANACAGRPGRAFGASPAWLEAIHGALVTLTPTRIAPFAVLAGEGTETFELAADLLLERLAAAARATGRSAQAACEAWSAVLALKAEAIDLNMDLALAARTAAAYAAPILAAAGRMGGDLDDHE